MNNTECSQADMYVLGGLSTEEVEQFEAHLLACPSCGEQVEETKEIIALLPIAYESEDVPQGMKGRILGNILKDQYSVQLADFRPKPSSQTSRTIRDIVIMPGLSAAVLFLLAFSWSMYAKNNQLQQKMVGMDTEISRLEASIDKHREAGQTPMLPETSVALAPQSNGTTAQGAATIVADAGGSHLLVQASRLPELTGTQAFQVWLLKDGKPSSAGTFTTRQGSGGLYFTMDNRDYDTIAITIEPDSYGQQPRGEIVLAASIQTI